MRLQQFQVDAFAERLFEGNPAAVVPLESWLPDALMQAIAAENNLSETAFFVPRGPAFELRWFTPLDEVDLCGHATLASAHVLFEELGHAAARISFHTKSGELVVERSGSRLSMDFPAVASEPCELPIALLEGLGRAPLETWVGDDYLALLADQAELAALAPDFERLGQLDRRGLIATAPGDAHDFVSRFFAPKLGVPEDPVTGSAHCLLTPFWAARLGRRSLRARQISARGGELECELVPGAAGAPDRVLLVGAALTFSAGELRL